MKVCELIAALNDCNPDADVVMPDGLDIGISTNHDESLVFICDLIDDSYDTPCQGGCDHCTCQE